MKKVLGRIAVVGVLALGGCDPGGGEDSGAPVPDAGAVDASGLDAGPADRDTGPADRDAGGGDMDAGDMDAGPDVDAGPIPTTIRGEVTGLETSVALELDGAETLLVEADGAFAFTTPTTVGAPYEVTIAGVSRDDYCVLEGASGAAPAEGEIAVHVRCEAGDQLTAAQSCFAEDGAETERAVRSATREADGSLVLTELGSDGPGADGVWFTDDDDGLHGNVLEYGAGAEAARRAIYVDQVGGDGALGTADDRIVRALRRTFDGELVDLLAVSQAPGPDGEWLTDDDLLEGDSFRLEITRDAMGRLTCWGAFHPGPDQLLGTADDVAGGGMQFVHDTDPAVGGAPRLTEARLSDLGADREACTGDDVIAARRREWLDSDGRLWLIDGNVDSAVTYTERRYNADGLVVASLVWSKTDGVVDGPGSGDDTFARAVETERDAAGELQFAGTVDDPGADGVPLTTDDLYTANARYQTRDADGEINLTYNYPAGIPLVGPDGVRGTPDDPATRMILEDRVDGSTVCRVFVDEPGPNGLWDARDCGNAHRDGGAAHDDVIDHVVWFERDARGLALRSGSSTGPGADGLWGNADDVLNGQSVQFIREVSPERYVALVVTGFGTDGLPFTPDDELRDRASLGGLDANGFQAFSGSVEAPGADGIHFTGDDVGVSYRIREFDVTGRRLSQTDYGYVGADGDWFTADDTPRCTETYEAVPRLPND